MEKFKNIFSSNVEDQNNEETGIVDEVSIIFYSQMVYLHSLIKNLLIISSYGKILRLVGRLE